MVPLARTQLLTTQEVDDGLVVYDLVTNDVHSLNPVTAAVWQMSDGTATVDEIAHELGGVLEPDGGGPVEMRALVWLSIRELSAAGLMESANDEPPGPALTRRGALSRLGRAALVAGGVLPLVVTALAPKVAHAVSTVDADKCVVVPGKCKPGCAAPRDDEPCTGTCKFVRGFGVNECKCCR